MHWLQDRLFCRMGFVYGRESIRDAVALVDGGCPDCAPARSDNRLCDGVGDFDAALLDFIEEQIGGHIAFLKNAAALADGA